MCSTIVQASLIGRHIPLAHQMFTKVLDGHILCETTWKTAKSTATLQLQERVIDS